MNWNKLIPSKFSLTRKSSYVFLDLPILLLYANSILMFFLPRFLFMTDYSFSLLLSQNIFAWCVKILSICTWKAMKNVNLIWFVSNKCKNCFWQCKWVGDERRLILWGEISPFMGMDFRLNWCLLKFNR